LAALLKENIELLHRYGLLQQIVRIPEDETEALAEVWLRLEGDDLAGDLDRHELTALHPNWIAIGRAWEEAENGVRALRRPAPKHLLVGLFPTDSYNAQARVSEAGALILIDKGLVRLLRSTCKLALASFTIDGEGPELDDR
jgi:hypothetical protein